MILPSLWNAVWNDDLSRWDVSVRVDGWNVQWLVVEAVDADRLRLLAGGEDNPHEGGVAPDSLTIAVESACGFFLESDVVRAGGKLLGVLEVDWSEPLVPVLFTPAAVVCRHTGEMGGVGIGVAFGGALVALCGVVAPVLGDAVAAIRGLGL